MIDPTMESNARIFLSAECAEYRDKLMDKAGELIAQAAIDCGDNHKELFYAARAILNAYINELTYTKMG